MSPDEIDALLATRRQVTNAKFSDSVDAEYVSRARDSDSGASGNRRSNGADHHPGYSKFEKNRPDSEVRRGCVVNLAKALLLFLVLGGLAYGAYTLNTQRTEEERLATEATMLATEGKPLIDLGCRPPEILSAPVSNRFARPRIDETSVHVGPRSDCFVVGTVDRDVRLRVLSGSVDVNGETWVSVLELLPNNDLSTPIQGWVRESDLLPVED